MNTRIAVLNASSRSDGIFSRATSRLAGGVALVVCLASVPLASCTMKSGGPSVVASQQSDLEIPCEPKRVLETVCQECHGNPTRNHAPFQLVTYADTQVVASGEPLWHYMRIVVQTGVMPLPPVQMNAADRETLSKWLNAGAPARGANESCVASIDSTEGGMEESGAAPDSADDEAEVEPDSASVADAGVVVDGLDAAQSDAAQGNEDPAIFADATPVQPN